VSVDFNIVDYSFNPANLPTSLNVIKDYVNPSNPKVVPDSNTTFDQRFFVAYHNESGVETAYLALERLQGKFMIQAPNIAPWNGAKYYFGNYNGTAPMQSIVQHYKSDQGDTFVSNTFRALMAYSTNSSDLVIDPDDKVVLGYPIAESYLTQLINAQLTGHGLGAIGNYNAKPIYSNNTFGMTYDNLFVV